MNTSDSRLYYEVAISSWKGYNPSSLQYVVQDDSFCDNNRRNISERVGKVVQK